MTEPSVGGAAERPADGMCEACGGDGSPYPQKCAACGGSYSSLRRAAVVRAERPAEPPKQGWYDTDDAPPRDVLAMVRLCAASWVPEARLLGNVRAGDIVRALDVFLRPAASQVGEPREPPEPTMPAAFEAEIERLTAEYLRVTGEKMGANIYGNAIKALVQSALRAGAPPTEDSRVVERINRLIASDSYAMTFQTMGQYRAALLRETVDPAGGHPTRGRKRSE